MNLWHKMLIVIASFILLVLFIIFLYIEEVILPIHVWIMIAVSLFLLLFICIALILVHYMNIKKDDLSMKITPDQDIAQTRDEMKRKGIILLFSIDSRRSSEGRTFTGKNTIIHYFMCFATIGMRKCPCFFMRRLDTPELKNFMINKTPSKDDIRNMLVEISSGKMEENEITAVTENAISGVKRTFHQKSYKPIEEQKEALMPEKKEEPPKPPEVIPSG